MNSLPRQTGRYPDIEDHGVIGDLRTTALVCVDGTIDFLCWPRFDSPSVFASLLDADRGGRFALSPVDEPTRRQQMYLPETNVLLTRFLSHDGVAEIVDFMPPAPEYEDQALIRIVRGIRGVVRFELVLEPRFDYARAAARVTAENDTVILAPGDGDGPRLRLRAPVELAHGHGRGGPRLTSTFTIHSGEELAFVLEAAEAGADSPFANKAGVDEALDHTVSYWHDWSAQITYGGRWTAMVQRSALVLKLLTAAEHGAIVAAPTFGLPERIGSSATWDYRYCWIRDTAFAMQALARLGLRDDAWALARWLEDRCCARNGRPIEVLYTVADDGDARESTLDSLEGYRGSSPVRIGNAARTQLQLDIFGEFIDALHTYDPSGATLPNSAWAAIVELLDELAQRWSEPDHGIWELREQPRGHLHSRVSCWIAFDRAIRLARGNGRPAPLDRWRRVRDTIYADVWSEFWDPEWSAFLGNTVERSLDASALVMSLRGFVSPRDPRWREMLAAVDARLVEDSLVYRFAPEAEDGGPPATFSLCTFWYVECLSQAEQLYDARNVFEKMLRHANHLGLYAEQLGPCGEHLGNFPQALTHIGLINAAVDLNERLEARAEPRRSRPSGHRT